MMQSCASAAKLRGGGPILNRGSKTIVHIGLPPPRSVNCSLASRRDRAAELQQCLVIVTLPAEGADLPESRRWSRAATAQ